VGVCDPHGHVVAELQDMLDSIHYQAAFGDGYAMTLDEAIEYARSSVD
jgi:hypothetical protein